MKFEDIENKIFLGDCQELLPHILEKVDRSKVILVSDPPFNVGYHYNTYKDNLDDKRIIERIENGSEGGRLYDWWEINQVKNVSNDKTSHPCQMPIKVMKNIIGILPDDAIIIDPFTGSGTTLLAVKIMNEEQNANRKYIGIEIDPEYHKIAVDRLNGITAYGQTSIFTDFDSLENKGE